MRRILRALALSVALIVATAVLPASAPAAPLTPGTVVNVHFNSVGVAYVIGIHDGGPPDPFNLSVDGGPGLLGNDWTALAANLNDVAQYYYNGDLQKPRMIAYLHTPWPAAGRETQAFVGAAMWEVNADFVDSSPSSLNATASVPEPATLGLLGCAVAVVVLARRRTR